MPLQTVRVRPWMQRLIWLLLLWLGGVAAVAALAYGLRFIVHIVGA